jgi:peptide/nickel transport system permease protein
MARYILIRIAQGLLTLFAVAAVVFVLSRLSGDPLALIMDPMATQADYAAERQRLGLDKSYGEQFVVFLANAVQGDFGTSIFHKKPAFDVFFERLPATLELGFAALFFALLIAIPVGVISAVHKNTLIDQVAKTFALIGQSAPIFWIGLVLMLVFAVTLRWLPTSGRGDWVQLVLPAVTLGWYSNAFLMRITRSAMLDVLDSEYVKLARLEGIPKAWIVWKHALKNASTSIITTLGLMTISLVTGAVVTETVFAWPGVGRLMVDSIFNRDFPVVQAAVTLVAVMVVGTNLLVDLIYAYIDPRVRFA